MRAVARPTPDRRRGAAVGALPVLQLADAHDLRGDAARRAATPTTRCRSSATANVNCRILPGVSPASVKDKLVEVLADPKITVSFVDEAQPEPAVAAASRRHGRRRVAHQSRCSPASSSCR